MQRLADLLALTRGSAFLKVSAAGAEQSISDSGSGYSGPAMPLTLDLGKSVGSVATAAAAPLMEHVASTPEALCIDTAVRQFVQLLTARLPQTCSVYQGTFSELASDTLRLSATNVNDTAFLVLSGMEQVDLTTELFAKLDELLFTHSTGDLSLVCFFASEIIPYPILSFFDVYCELGSDDAQKVTQDTDSIALTSFTDKIDAVQIHYALRNKIYNTVLHLSNTNFYYEASYQVPPAGEGKEASECTLELTPLKLDLFSIRVVERWAKAIAMYSSIKSQTPLRPIVGPEHIREAYCLVLTHRVAAMPLTELTLEERGRIPGSLRWLGKIHKMLSELVM